ncbi:MAG: 2-oxoacid:acceptor oxidoreductase subunit alpha [archaeon]
MELIEGNEAIVKGAVKAGLGFFAGYPITPASEIMHSIAKRKDVNFVQMEDEIAAVNAVIGGSLGGAKSFTATSGPGFSLMQEGIGFAHMIEVPIVIVNVQRVGPSTGMPTKTAQGDLMQSKFGSHGDYFPIVFYPNSVTELYEMTIQAFNASEKASMPVVLLSDGFLAHLHETVDLEKMNLKIEERKLKPFGKEKRHFTGLTHEGNIPMPQDFEVHKKFLEHLKEKTEKVAKEHAYFEFSGNKKSKTLIICFGGLSRRLSYLKDEFAFFRPIRIWPVLEKELKIVAEKFDKVVVIEENMGQYVREVERVLKKEVKFISIFGEFDSEKLREQLK